MVPKSQILFKRSAITSVTYKPASYFCGELTVLEDRSILNGISEVRVELFELDPCISSTLIVELIEVGSLLPFNTWNDKSMKFNYFTVYETINVKRKVILHYSEYWLIKLTEQLRVEK